MRKNVMYLCMALLALVTSRDVRAEFVRGVDISIQTKQEAGDEFSPGVVYYEYGVAKDAITILKNHDVNWGRARLFVNPDMGDYGTGIDLDYVTTLGARMKSEGLKFLLDLHYSDTWADAANQAKPSVWNGLSQAQLETAVHDYTRDVVAHLRANGAMPDMVQIGNETICGMLWPNGELCSNANWDNYVALINAGIDGVDAGRGGSAMPEIMIHIDKGGDQVQTQWFFDNLISRGVQFDLIGQSFYPEWHGTLDDLSANLNFMAQNYSQDIILAEIGTYYGSVTGASPEGQKEFIEEVISRVEAVPNGKGRGVFYWEPTWTWNSTDGYRALFEPTVDQWGNDDWDDVEMLMALEAFNAIDKYSTYSTAIDGSVSGSIMGGHNSDDVYETITERTSGGSPRNRYSYLEHKWTFNKISGDATFNVEAHKTSNNEGDDFVFAYSTDDSVYTGMLTVTETSDNDTVQSYALPAGINGTVYIRVFDTDQTGGNSSKDKIYIDDMYIAAIPSGGDTTPPVPNPMEWIQPPYPTGTTSIQMEAKTALDASGVEYYFTCTSGGGNDSGWQAGTIYEDTGLTEGNTYTYTVKARDLSASLNETASSSAASSTTIFGTAVTVQNYSFEDDGAIEYNDFTPTGWTWNGLGEHGTSTQDSGEGKISDGPVVYWQGNSATLYQTTAQTINAAGERYVLIVDARNTWLAEMQIAIYYDDGGNRMELASTSLPADGQWWDSYKTLSVVATTTAASVGNNIGIELSIANDNGHYGRYDFVRLYGEAGQSCTANDIHVESIVPSAINGGQGRKYGRATVTIQNNCGDPVSGAMVSGTFSGDYSESQSAVTDGSGVAVLTTAAKVKKPSFTFCVDNLVGSLPYDPADNVETCDSY